jgi:fumarylacetoacetase
MSHDLDDTHDPALQSWVESANTATTDFPIQNLPFGRFRGKYKRGADGSWRIGVAIGDRILDLRGAGLIGTADMNELMKMDVAARRGLRERISAGLRRGASEERIWAACLTSQRDAEMALPCTIGDYTDFYTGIHHATTVGRLFRPDQPLMPNYKWVPIGYHGRASSIVASGHDFPRPSGQRRSSEENVPGFGPSRRLDYELELGYYVGRPNALGTSIPMAAAEEHLFGMGLLNDWSARDIQAWEYQPLGPFLAKNFCTTVSPWIVTLEALAPFRKPFTRPEGDPQPLPYLDSPHNRAAGAFDIVIETWLQTEKMFSAAQPGVRLSRSNALDAYWTPAQLIAHHTVNGCNLNSGDLLGSGTLSGPNADQGGSLLELTLGGKQAVTLANGETRSFLEDGDAVILRAHCERPGYRRIGFGECRGAVLPARG